MNTTWRILLLARLLLLGVMAIYAIWLETLAPEVFVKAFLLLVVGSLVLLLVQTALKKSADQDHEKLSRHRLRLASFCPTAILGLLEITHSLAAILGGFKLLTGNITRGQIAAIKHDHAAFKPCPIPNLHTVH